MVNLRFIKVCVILCKSEAGIKLNICGNTHMASGPLVSQQLSPRSALETALLMQHQQPVVDHLTTFHSFTPCYLFELTS